MAFAIKNCGCGGIGRRVRLRGVWETVWVQVPSTAPKIRVEEPGFFFTQNAQKAFIHIAFLKVHDATWISLKSSEIMMGCTRVTHTLHTDLCTVFLNKRGLGKPRLHALWRISHTANLFCPPGRRGFFVVLPASSWYNQLDKSKFGLIIKEEFLCKKMRPRKSI